MRDLIGRLKSPPAAREFGPKSFTYAGYSGIVRMTRSVGLVELPTYFRDGARLDAIGAWSMLVAFLQINELVSV